MAMKRDDKKGARYRLVLTEMHADQKFRALTPPPPSGQTLWTNLLIGPFTTLIPGVLVVGEAGFAERLKWTIEDFRSCLGEITDLDMARVDWTGPLIFLPNALKHNPPQSPSVVKGWRQAWAEIPSCPLKADAARHIRECLSKIGPGWARAFDDITGSAYKPSGPSELSQVAPETHTQLTTQSPPQDETQSEPQIGTQISSHQEQEQEQDLSPPTPSREGACVFTRDVGRRSHPLDERVRLEPWSMTAFDEFWALYPRKDGEVAALRAWHALNPPRELAALVVEHIRVRLKLGWATDVPLHFLPLARTFLDERRWQEKYTPRQSTAPPAPATSAVPDADETVRMLAAHRKAVQT